MGKWVHRVTDINEATRTGTCAECGVVRLKKRKQPSGKVRWACYKAERKWRGPQPTTSWSAAQRRERERLIAEQNNKCAICGEEMTPPNLDHCHKSGQIRGVLCRSCNVGLGFMRDDPELLRAAIRYLG